MTYKKNCGHPRSCPGDCTRGDREILLQDADFFYKGNLIHFAAYRGHIGFYPTPSGTESFAAELSVYKSGKGSVQLPLDKPLPLDLLGRIIAYRKTENEQQELLAKQAAKEKAKAKAIKRQQEKLK